MISSNPPRVLLVGAGKFGMRHLAVLQGLSDLRKITLVGAVVSSSKSARNLKGKITTPVFKELSDELLNSVDAVIIATPMETHAELVQRILPHAHVLVEKPLATSISDANKLVHLSKKKGGHALMVGHIFRFDSTVMMLKKILKDRFAEAIEVTFTQPETEDKGRDIELELLHPYDIADFLFGKRLEKKYIEKRGRLHLIGAMYQGGTNAIYRIGWSGKNKTRTIKVSIGDTTIIADLIEGKIVTWKKGRQLKQLDCVSQVTPLERELSHFLRVIKGGVDYPDARVGARIVEAAVREQDRVVRKGKRQKVAIIGAGIFGTNCAIELSSNFDVTVLEKNEDILTEASKYNQYRHHWGYHYPRSQETMNDIASTIREFEERYNPAIIRDFPTYYSVAKDGSKVTTKAYMEFCRKNNLTYKVEHPDEDYLNRKKVDISLKTFEPIYNFEELKLITSKLLRECKVKLKFNHEVVGARLGADGEKILRVRTPKDGIVEKEFDYVINVTYARYNHFAKWIGFPVKAIRLDLVEVMWVKLNIPKISFAIMDGPFTNMVPTEKENTFTLVHIKHSIRKRFVAKDGLVPKDIFALKGPLTQKIIKESAKWLPIVKKATVDNIYYVLRGVNAYRESDDARPSDITEHGFGCYSILGGKIVHSVAIAREVAGRLKKQLPPN